MYKEEIESDDKEKGLVIDICKKKWKMAVTRSNRGKWEQKTNDDDNINDVDPKKVSPELAITTLRKRIFNNEVDYNDEGKDDDEDSDHGASWMNKKRKKNNEITMLKRKIRTLEIFIDEVDDNDEGKNDN